MKIQVGKASALIVFIILVLTPIFIWQISIAQALAPPIVQTTLQIIADGSTPFDGTTFDPNALTNPGTDATATNGIVRNSDSITYRVETNLNGEDSDNLTFTLTLSSDQGIIALPSQCLTTRNGAALNPISSISLNNQVLVCNTGVAQQGTTSRVDVIAQSKATTPNNTTISANVTASADGTNTASAGPVTLISTARPLYDVAQSYMSTTFGTYDYGGGNVPGQIVTWSLTGRYVKGSESLTNGTIVLTATLNNSAGTNNIVPNGCGQFNLVGNVPFGAVGIESFATTANSVEDSGVVSCAQPGGPGTPLEITLTNPELNSETFPYLFSSNTVIPAGDSYFVSIYYRTFHPTSDIPVGTAITVTNTVSPTTVPLSITAQVASESTLLNNVALHSLQYDPNSGVTAGGQMSDNIYPTTPFDGIHSRSDFVAIRNSTQTFVPGYDIPFDVDFANAHNNGILVNAFQVPEADDIICVKPDANMEFTGQHRTSYASASGASGNTDVIQKFFRGEYPGNIAPSTMPYLTSGAKIMNPDPDFSSDHFSFIRITTTAPGPKTVYLIPLVVEYSFDEPISVPYSECEDSDATWLSSFGATPELVRQIRYSIDYPEQVYGAAFVTTYIEAQPIFQLKDNTPVNDFGAIWVSQYAQATVSANSPYVWWHSAANDDPLNSNYALDPNSTNSPGMSHRVLAASDIVRVKKTVLNTNEDLTPRTSFATGDTIDYRLTTTIQQLPSSGDVSSITLTDVLPSGLTYNYDSEVVQGGPCPVVVSNDTPGAGQTTLTWTCTLADNLTPEINFSASVNANVVSGTYTNSVVISSPSDTVSTANERTSTVGITVNTRGSFNVAKRSLTPAIEQDDDAVFALDYANTGTIALTDTKFIDILPYNSNPLDPESDFNGTTTFENISGTNSETFEFTAADRTTINIDPCHVSNVPAGQTSITYTFCNSMTQLNGGAVGTETTVWCTLAAPFNDGTFAALGAGCPHSLAEVTGVRISGGAFATGQAKRTVTLSMATAGNELADIYANEFGGRASNYQLFVASNDPIVEVASGSIGDYVWDDSDGDGVQDSDESGIAGVGITLTYAGPDDTFGNGDDEVFTTTTDADGFYEFVGLQIGIYQIEIDSLTLPLGSTQTYDLDGNGTLYVAEVTLEQVFSGTGLLLGIENQSDVDFGYDLPGSSSSGSGSNNDPPVIFPPTVPPGTPPGTPPIDGGVQAGENGLPVTGTPAVGLLAILLLMIAPFVAGTILFRKLSTK